MHCTPQDELRQNLPAVSAPLTATHASIQTTYHLTQDPGDGVSSLSRPADATLSFELAEKVLRDRLRWLVTAGAGLKALLTSALAHSLRAAADMGEVGQAAGGTTVGQLRAPEEELLTPFPQHVLVSE